MKKFGSESTKFFQKFDRIAYILNSVYELTKLLCKDTDIKRGKWYIVSFYFRKEKGKNSFSINEVCVRQDDGKEENETISRLT